MEPEAGGSSEARHAQDVVLIFLMTKITFLSEAELKGGCVRTGMF